MYTCYKDTFLIPKSKTPHTVIIFILYNDHVFFDVLISVYYANMKHSKQYLH